MTLKRIPAGMRIVLIDNPKQMEMLHAQNPTLADKFECIGCDYPVPGAAAGGDEASGAAASGAGAAAKAPAADVDDRPVRHVVPVRDSAAQPPVAQYRPESHDEEPDDYEDAPAEDEMDIDEFAQYACKYASEIDCSITGKSMLALYERIEIMEEDGIPLTRTTAEDLIEEAADRAEKPSVGKLITGLFFSKYDKDGLLVLKEEHFI